MNCPLETVFSIASLVLWGRAGPFAEDVDADVQEVEGDRGGDRGVDR